jgi:hypothetical protein
MGVAGDGKGHGVPDGAEAGRSRAQERDSHRWTASLGKLTHIIHPKPYTFHLRKVSIQVLMRLHVC